MRSCSIVLASFAVLLSGCTTTQKPEAQEPQSTMAVQTAPKTAAKDTFVVAADGVKIHYLVVGEGTPVVLIHGYYANAEGNWFLNGLVDQLKVKHRVIALDCRGHGGSDKPHDAAAYGQHMWQDVIAVMDQEHVKKAHIHGYSMGGSITLQLMAHHPERFLSAAFGGSGIPETLPAQIAATPADAVGPDPREAAARAQLMSAIPHDLVAMHALQENAPWSGPEVETLDLKTIKFPVLALNGEFDSPLAKTHRMQRELANFRSVVFPGRSHLTTISPGYIPAEYGQELGAFLDRSDRL